MIFKQFSLGLRAFSSIACLVLAAPLSADSVNGDEMKPFGFRGPEIFPVDHGIGQLREADFNGDGLRDLAVVNNLRSKITLLVNQTGSTNRSDASKSRHLEQNELPPDSRFRIESIASEKRISSMAVADLNSDSRPDIAYFGEPKELVIQYNQGTNGWSAGKRWPLTQGLLNMNALVQGDLNGDDRSDLLLLAEGFIYFLAQDENDTLREPEKIPYSGAVKAVQVLDIQGDGRDDLLLVDWDSGHPFRFRLQTEQGELGPELHFDLPAIRSYWADDLDGDRKTEVITVAQQSGRAQLSQFARAEADPLSGEWRQGQFHALPLKKTGKARRGLVWFDMNRDGLPDLLAADPDSAQLTLYLQAREGSLTQSKTFATLSGVSELAAADWNQDGRPEIFLLSNDERQIGISQLDDSERIEFPSILPLSERPLAMAVGQFSSDESPVLAVITDRDGKRALQVHSASGKVVDTKLSDEYRSNPASLTFHDVDQDGRSDLVVLTPYEKVKVLLRRDNQRFEEIDVAPPGGVIDQPWMSAADVDGDGKPELLLAQRNFLRAVVLNASSAPAADSSSWSFEVKEQINGAGSNSRITGATALRNGDRSIASIFLLDAERKALTLTERDESGVWRIVRNIQLPLTDFQALATVGIGRSEANSVAFHGVNSVAWLALQGSVWRFEELDGYETPIRGGYLTDVVSGDLNQDERKDLVFMETGRSYLDIVTFEPPHQLVPANRWQVFEERTFRSRRNVRPEPREALVVELTGDQKNDLAVVVHDRILVYPQE